jgi:competence protein ComEC
VTYWVVPRSLFLSVITAVVLLSRGASAQLTIHFLDVGQGDAALIRARRSNVLIDAGASPRQVASWLRRAGVDTIHLAIASHNHADHIGGMPAVLAKFPVRNYMENGMVATTQVYAQVVGLLEQREITVLNATPRTIDLGDGVSIRVLLSSPRARTQNDASVGIEVRYGRFRALFSGDAELRQREFWLGSKLEPVQVLKVSHHGSENGTDRALLDAIRPCAAVISVGAKNSFNHPSPAVLALLKASAVAMYRTDVVGQITITADSTGLFRASTQRGKGQPTTFSHPCR